MAKYMFTVSYTAEGAKGLLKEGGSKRREAASAAAKALGGSIEAFYFAFGGKDAVVICDLPDHAAAAALSMAVGASGAMHGETTVLFTPEEMDAACKRDTKYRAPGR